VTGKILSKDSRDGVARPLNQSHGLEASASGS
jgi:hypothetical protein